MNRDAMCLAIYWFRRSMFELIPRPIEFLQSMRRTLGERSEARFYLDIPNTSYVFRIARCGICFTNSATTLSKRHWSTLSRGRDSPCSSSGECLGEGYYLYVEAAPSDDHELPAPGVEMHDVPDQLQGLTEHLQNQLILWGERFETWIAQDKRVVAWGSGGRAINFLNMITASDCIEHIVDINPARHGGFISGSGQQIIAPAALAALRPDLVVITNGLYGTEIREQVASLGLDCEFAEI